MVRLAPARKWGMSMRGLVVSILCAGVLAACSNERAAPAAQPSGSTEGLATPAAPVTAAPSSAAVVTAVAARKVEEATELIDFEYVYPAAAGAIPALKARFDADLAKKRADLVREATAARAEAKQGGFDFHAYGYWLDWRVVADLPDWLSLSGDLSTYEGGAHPNHGFDAMVWDRKAGKRLDPVEMFASPGALSAAIGDDFCAAINVQRRNKRGEEWQLGGEFDDCIDPVASTVILGSKGGKAFDRVGVLVAPYDAGPYAEGDYEVTLPVTPAVMAAVKPQYRSAFVVKR
jgi:Deacetylase PdaC